MTIGNWQLCVENVSSSRSGGRRTRQRGIKVLVLVWEKTATTQNKDRNGCNVGAAEKVFLLQRMLMAIEK